ncbi:hypothetical protein LIER_09482 [Lithospermum erythrorhizon]|uniref:DUF4283 domain-containing protein n=1 Tax=Lithospermum erythrorhizon TaxID=34254 RepID=A0AAV3PFQ6_LITER
MKEWARNIDPLRINFSECLFWIHLRGLKDEFLTKDVASKLAADFERCDSVKLKKDKMGRNFFRIRAKVIVDCPIQRTLQFLVGDALISGYLAYKRLPNLCFRCGLGDSVKQCPTLSEKADPRKNLAYDLWIKASIEKSWIVFKLEEDLEANEVIQALGGGQSRFKLSDE